MIICEQQLQEPNLICCPVVVRSAMHVLSQVDLWQIISPHQLRYVTFTSPACKPHPLPCMSHPGDIEHFIKHTLLGSNVTILSRSLSIPPWPFSAFHFAGCQAWWCSRMESIQRSHTVQGVGGEEVCIGVMWSAESRRSLIPALKYQASLSLQQFNYNSIWVRITSVKPE